MAALFAGIGAIAVSMLTKLIGYEFVARVTVIGLNAWSKSTETKYDDKVAEAMAKAWGVDVADLKSIEK